MPRVHKVDCDGGPESSVGRNVTPATADSAAIPDVSPLAWAGLVLRREPVHPNWIPLAIQQLTDEAVGVTGVVTLHPCTLCGTPGGG
jgi:hypothetical protein